MLQDEQAIGTAYNKQLILSHIEKHRQVTVSEVSEFLGSSKVRIRAILNEMVSDGVIEKIGNYRYTHYVPRQGK